MAGAERFGVPSGRSRGQLEGDSEAWLLWVVVDSLDPELGGCSVGELLGLDGGVGSGDAVVTRGDGVPDEGDSLGEPEGLTVGVGLGVLEVGVGLGLGVGVVGVGVGVIGLAEGVMEDGSPAGM